MAAQRVGIRNLAQFLAAGCQSFFGVLIESWKHGQICSKNGVGRDLIVHASQKPATQIFRMSASLEELTSSAVSMVVAGNTGITPFLTLLIIALIERSDPEILNMQGRLEEYLASDVGVGLLATATALEFLSMCIPIVDEMVDAGMTFIIPIISAVASASTFGLFLQTEDSAGDERLLQKAAWIGPLQVFLIVIGIVLSLSVHFCKMIVRLIGEGWLTGCLTVMETIWTTSTIFIVIYIQPVAIAVAILICIAAGYGAYRIFKRIQSRRAAAAANVEGNTEAAEDIEATKAKAEKAASAPVERTEGVADVELGKTTAVGGETEDTK